MSNLNRYVLGKNRFERWIIISESHPMLAWSGSRWVPMNGSVQICNFESPEAACFYAQEVGLQAGADAKVQA